jgi:hypothetical protein
MLSGMVLLSGRPAGYRRWRIGGGRVPCRDLPFLVTAGTPPALRGGRPGSVNAGRCRTGTVCGMAARSNVRTVARTLTKALGVATAEFPDPNCDLAWIDGPALAGVQLAVRQAAGMRGGPVDSDRLAVHVGSIDRVQVTRYYRPVTAAVHVLREQPRTADAAASSLAWTDLPAAGLTPDTDAERIAVQLILDQLDDTDLKPCPARLAGRILHACASLGGIRALLDAAAAATR